MDDILAVLTVGPSHDSSLLCLDYRGCGVLSDAFFKAAKETGVSLAFARVLGRQWIADTPHHLWGPL